MPMFVCLSFLYGHHFDVAVYVRIHIVMCDFWLDPIKVQQFLAPCLVRSYDGAALSVGVDFYDSVTLGHR